MLGGGLRQAGVLAAAGIHALEHHVDRLIDDHVRAAQLAEALSELDRIEVNALNTNMIFISIDAPADDLSERLRDRGVLCDVPRTRGLREPSPYTQLVGARLVTHLDVSDDDVSAAADAFASAINT